METNTIQTDIIEKKCFSEEELLNLGFEYTCQNYSKYLIFKKENKYYLMDEIEQNQFQVQFDFDESN